MRRRLRTAAYATATAIAPSFAYQFQRRRHHHGFGADELHRVENGQGFRIALWRFRAKGSDRGHPVILCPGLGANRFSFEPHPDVSLARHLRDQGFDTWVIELRGHGASDRASRERPWGWSFDDHVEADVPAAIEGVRRITGARGVHWIGHSMGGLLLYAHLARGGASLRSGTTVGSSLDYSGSGSWFEPISRLAPITRYVPAVPIGALQTLASPFGPRPDNPLDEFNIWFSNTEPRVWRKLQAIGWHSVSSPVLAQLATAFEEGGLARADRSGRYLRDVGSAKVPVMAIAGTVDRQCPPAAAARTAGALSHPESRLVVFGTTHGHEDEYGHFDLVMGKRAPKEVWPRLVAWLEACD